MCESRLLHILNASCSECEEHESRPAVFEYPLITSCTSPPAELISPRGPAQFCFPFPPSRPRREHALYTRRHLDYTKTTTHTSSHPPRCNARIPVPPLLCLPHFRLTSFRVSLLCHFLCSAPNGLGRPGRPGRRLPTCRYRFSNVSSTGILRSRCSRALILTNLCQPGAGNSLRQESGLRGGGGRVDRCYAGAASGIVWCVCVLCEREDERGIMIYVWMAG